jgi:excisionase family DNA binding protein
MTTKLLKPEEVATLLGFKIKTVYNWVNLRRIPHIKLGGKLRFDEAVIHEWTKQFAVSVEEDVLADSE